MTFEKNGINVYSILRQADYKVTEQGLSRKPKSEAFKILSEYTAAFWLLKEFFTERYRYRQCEEAPCPDYFDILLEVPVESCLKPSSERLSQITEEKLFAIAKKYFSDNTIFSNEPVGKCYDCYTNNWDNR